MSDLLAIRDSTLATARSLTESVRLTDRVNVWRTDGRTTQDEETGEESAVWEIIHPAIPFRLAGTSSSDGGSHTVTIGGVTYEQATAVGQFPAGTSDLADNDFIEVVSGEWPGAVFSIVAAISSDQKTARRVPIREQQRPEEWDS